RKRKSQSADRDGLRTLRGLRREGRPCLPAPRAVPLMCAQSRSQAHSTTIKKPARSRILSPGFGRLGRDLGPRLRGQGFGAKDLGPRIWGQGSWARDNEENLGKPAMSAAVEGMMSSAGPLNGGSDVAGASTPTGAKEAARDDKIAEEERQRRR